MIDQEGHDAGIAILRRIGDQREAADHLAFDDIVEGAAGRIRPLPLQDAKIVAVVGRPLPVDLVTFGRRLRRQFAERAWIAVVAVDTQPKARRAS
jgi:hypothetical protein